MTTNMPRSVILNAVKNLAPSVILGAAKNLTRSVILNAVKNLSNRGPRSFAPLRMTTILP
jgi:hypothetical protein